MPLNVIKNAKLTQKSCCSLSRCAKSSNGIVQLATKSSGGMAASWNTVKPIFFALFTSWMKISFQHGSNVFPLVVERSGEKKNTNQNEYGYYGKLDIIFFHLCLLIKCFPIFSLLKNGISCRTNVRIDVTKSELVA